MKAMKLSLLAVAAMAAVSCAKEIAPETDNTPVTNPNLVQITLKASGESAQEPSKAVFSGYPKIAWAADDQISLLGTKTGNQQLTTTGKGHEVSFTGYADKTDDLYHAVYPYDENVELTEDGKLANVTVPSVQTAAAGTFDPKAYIAVAKSTDRENLHFKGVGAFVKFKVEDAENVKSVTMVSNSGANMACTANVSLNADGGVSHGAPYTNSSTSVKLVGTFETDKAYFMVIRPQPYDGGVTFYIEYKNGIILKRTGTSALFEQGQARNNIRNLNTLLKKDFTPVTDLYTLYNLGYDITVGGKTFNKETVSATHITANSSSKNIGNNGLYFVDSDVVSNLGSGLSQVAIIGTDPAKRTSINRTGGYFKIAATGGEDYFILSGINLTIDPKTATYSIRIEGSNTCERIVFDNCSATIPAAAQWIYADGSNFVKNITIKDSEFLVGAGNTNNFLNFAATQTVDRIEFNNNVFYSTSIEEPATSFTLISAGNTTVTDAIIDRNTFYGAYPAATGSNITNCKTQNFTITNNMFGLRKDATTNSNIVAAKISGNAYIKNNAYYKNGSVAAIGGVSGSYVTTGTNEGLSSVGISTNNWNPSDGKFTIHSKYGATR